MGLCLVGRSYDHVGLRQWIVKDSFCVEPLEFILVCLKLNYNGMTYFLFLNVASVGKIFMFLIAINWWICLSVVRDQYIVSE